MAYDETLAVRIRAIVGSGANIVERKMFGGIGWMVSGSMAVGAHSGGGLIVRCAKGDHESLTAEPGVTGMVQRGSEMRGWLLIDAETVNDDDSLQKWVSRGVEFARTVPKK